MEHVVGLLHHRLGFVPLNVLTASERNEWLRQAEADLGYFHAFRLLDEDIPCHELSAHTEPTDKRLNAIFARHRDARVIR